MYLEIWPIWVCESFYILLYSSLSYSEIFLLLHRECKQIAEPRKSFIFVIFSLFYFFSLNIILHLFSLIECVRDSQPFARHGHCIILACQSYWIVIAYSTTTDEDMFKTLKRLQTKPHVPFPFVFIYFLLFFFYVIPNQILNTKIWLLILHFKTWEELFWNILYLI